MSAPAQQQRQAPQKFTTEQAKSLLDQVLENTDTRLRVVGDALESRITKIEDVLPDAMKGQARRLAKRAMMTLARKTDLKDCPAPDFIRCVIEAAELGLAIDGKLAYVVRYKSTWQMQPDYKGLIAVAKRAGQIKDCYGDVVCRRDSFRAYRENGKSFLFHELPVGFAERGDVIGAYAVIILPDGDWRYELMDRPDLDRIQRRAPAKNGPWATDENEMRKKTVFRRALKLYCDDPAVIRTVELMDRDDDEEIAETPLPGRRTSLRNGHGAAMELPAPDDRYTISDPPPVEDPSAQPNPPEPEHKQEAPPETSEEDLRKLDAFNDFKERIAAAKEPADLAVINGDVRDKLEWLGGKACAQLMTLMDQQAEKIAPPVKGGKTNKRMF